MDDEVRKLLSTPDPTYEAYAKGRARLFAAIEEPKPKKINRRWSTVLAAAAATVAIVTTVTRFDSSFFAAPEPPPHQAAAQPSSSQILLDAADAAAGAPAGGAYWRTRTTTGRRFLSPDRHYVISSSTSREVWLTRRLGVPNLRITQPLGAKPVTAKDEEAWRTAGRPIRWRYPADVEGFGDVSASERVESAAGKAVSTRLQSPPGTLAGKRLTWTELAAVPGDEQGLRAYLEARGDELYASCVELLTSLPASPAVRASAYRILASLPGLRAEGVVTDPLGRTGQALDYRNDRLVIDVASGSPLATEVRLAGALTDGSAVELGSFTAFEEIGWTDQQPRRN
ncbi:CU044_5270 family protein [Nonomuraea sp. NPDC050556]|uniref:CU044_5270 family protein n=1 Tax=Nonomuraea sp. NPDC050556 TaxID=3364369 RepID=UPI0037BD4C2B